LLLFQLLLSSLLAQYLLLLLLLLLFLLFQFLLLLTMTRLLLLEIVLSVMSFTVGRRQGCEEVVDLGSGVGLCPGKPAQQSLPACLCIVNS